MSHNVEKSLFERLKRASFYGFVLNGIVKLKLSKGIKLEVVWYMLAGRPNTSI